MLGLVELVSIVETNKMKGRSWRCLEFGITAQPQLAGATRRSWTSLPSHNTTSQGIQDLPPKCLEKYLRSRTLLPAFLASSRALCLILVIAFGDARMRHYFVAMRTAIHDGIDWFRADGVFALGSWNQEIASTPSGDIVDEFWCEISRRSSESHATTAGAINRLWCATTTNPLDGPFTMVLIWISEADPGTILEERWRSLYCEVVGTCLFFLISFIDCVLRTTSLEMQGTLVRGGNNACISNSQNSQTRRGNETTCQGIRIYFVRSLLYWSHDKVSNQHAGQNSDIKRSEVRRGIKEEKKW